MIDPQDLFLQNSGIAKNSCEVAHFCRGLVQFCAIYAGLCEDFLKTRVYIYKEKKKTKNCHFEHKMPGLTRIATPRHANQQKVDLPIRLSSLGECNATQ